MLSSCGQTFALEGSTISPDASKPLAPEKIPYIARLFVRDPVVRHQLYCLAQSRVIQFAVAVRRARVHQFLRGRGVRKREAQRSRSLQCEIQVLLMQLDPKARVERTLYHAVT
ncbi:MAG: hypothetical protein JWQ50_7546, partial [Caballeronia mineralivorans]|nr:hypothetical protein [Caballeronia mineralivorans]